MPNTLAHLGVGGVLTRSLVPDADLRWVYIGCVIPDVPWILQRVAYSLPISVDLYNLRLFGVFGKYDDWRYRFIPNICSRAVLNLPITINQNTFFDYLYIDDLIKIVKWFLDDKPKKNIYNICTGKVYDFKTLAEKVLETSDKKLEIIIKKEGLGKEYSGDNSLLLSELKNFEFESIDNSIKDLYDWYDSNKEIINKNELL